MSTHSYLRRNHHGVFKPFIRFCFGSFVWVMAPLVTLQSSRIVQLDIKNVSPIQSINIVYMDRAITGCFHHHHDDGVNSICQIARPFAWYGQSHVFKRRFAVDFKRMERYDSFMQSRKLHLSWRIVSTQWILVGWSATNCGLVYNSQEQQYNHRRINRPIYLSVCQKFVNLIWWLNIIH